MVGVAIPSRLKPYARRVRIPLQPGPGSPAVDAVMERVLRAGFWVVAAFVAFQSVAQLVNTIFFGLRVSYFDADLDVGMFNWAGSVATYGAAFMLGVLAIQRPAQAKFVGALAFAVAFFSLDDDTAIHDRLGAVGDRLGVFEHFARDFWPIIYLPLLAAIFLGLLGVAQGIREPPGRMLVLGLVLLVSAVALEAASPVLFWLGSDRGKVPYELEVVLEEGAEFGGWGLISVALAAAALSLEPRAAVPPADAAAAAEPEKRAFTRR